MRCAELTSEPWLDQGRLRLLSEAAARLGRLYRHATSHPFVMLSASRRNATPAENKAASIALLKMIRDVGLGAIQVEGHYVEDTGPVSELSFFVPLTGRSSIYTGDALLAAGTKWGNTFGQETILYGDVQRVYRVRCDTGEFAVLSTTSQLTVHDLADEFSRLRGQAFKFAPPKGKPVTEQYHVVGYRIPTGYISALGMSADGLWPESERR